MKYKSNVLPIVTLIIVVLFYLPFVKFFVPVGKALLLWDRIYTFINPFTIMPIFLGGMSLYFISKNYRPVFKILFLIIYGISLFVALITVMVVLGLTPQNALFYLVPHLFIIALHFYVVRSTSFRELD